MLLCLAHGGVALALLLLVLERHDLLWLLAVLLPLIAASLAWQLLRLYGPRRVVCLTLQRDGVVELQYHDDAATFVQGRVESQTTVMPWLTVLLLRSSSGRRLSLTLLPDALDGEDFRRLRLWLRWIALEAEAGRDRQMFGNTGDIGNLR
ncbi:conserved protein of unknown function [Sterolibacterium denitrificans]|uniref:Toxin CptA n=2 Tax=Sterolibacterium denitrificans TaxID=157592 RepID=A0A7Z7MV91_9PROT|nr:protein YgfX [Sterolibacterium denitrificans]SMB26691.1 conserved protein of unknown function [Sterolibacterium denitrificans]